MEHIHRMKCSKSRLADMKFDFLALTLSLKEISRILTGKYLLTLVSKGTSPNCFSEQDLSFRLSVIFDSTLFFY